MNTGIAWPRGGGPITPLLEQRPPRRRELIIRPETGQFSPGKQWMPRLQYLRRLQGVRPTAQYFRIEFCTRGEACDHVCQIRAHGALLSENLPRRQQIGRALVQLLSPDLTQPLANLGFERFQFVERCEGSFRRIDSALPIART